jgi:hypothetical protein
LQRYRPVCELEPCRRRPSTPPAVSAPAASAWRPARPRTNRRPAPARSAGQSPTIATSWSTAAVALARWPARAGRASVPSARRHAATGTAPTPKSTRRTVAGAAPSATRGTAPARTASAPPPRSVTGSTTTSMGLSMSAPATRFAGVGCAAVLRGRGTATGTTGASNWARTSTALSAPRVPAARSAKAGRSPGRAAAPMARAIAARPAPPAAATPTAPPARSVRTGGAPPAMGLAAATAAAAWQARSV